jgi:hypothetical protein
MTMEIDQRPSPEDDLWFLQPQVGPAPAPGGFSWDNRLDQRLCRCAGCRGRARHDFDEYCAERLQHEQDQHTVKLHVGGKRKRKETLAMQDSNCRDCIPHRERTQTEQKQSRYRQYALWQGPKNTIAAAQTIASLLCGKTDTLEEVTATGYAAVAEGKGKRRRVVRSDKQYVHKWGATVVQAWDCMRALVRSADQHTLGAFVHACFERRTVAP